MKINIIQIWIELRKKKEIYKILQFEGNVYLLPLQEANLAYRAKQILGD